MKMMDFPVWRKRFSSSVPAHLMARAALPILAAGAAFTLHDVTVAALLFPVAGVLVVKTNFVPRVTGWEISRLELRRLVKAHRMRNNDGLGKSWHSVRIKRRAPLGDVLPFWLVMMSPLIGLAAGILVAWLSGR